MVTLLYSNGLGPISAAWLSSLVGLFIVIGEIVGGFAAKRIMFIKWQLVVSMLLGGIFFASRLGSCHHLRTDSFFIGTASCGPDDKGRACAFVALGVFFVGWGESLSITAVVVSPSIADILQLVPSTDLVQSTIFPDLHSGASKTSPLA